MPYIMVNKGRNTVYDVYAANVNFNKYIGILKPRRTKKYTYKLYVPTDEDEFSDLNPVNPRKRKGFMLLLRIVRVLFNYFFLLFLVCGLTPATAVSQESASGAVDHVVSELQHKGIFAYKVAKPLDQLKDDTIVQVVNEEGHINYKYKKIWQVFFLKNCRNTLFQ